jgi:ABC-type multidrug transport system ATPase subunit
MEIIINQLGKRFKYEWIYQNLNLQLQSGKSYAILGPNGSGKSTFLKSLSGLLPATEGTIEYSIKGKKISPEYWYKYIVWAAPYLELIEEFTLQEQVDFQRKFKKFKENISTKDFISQIGLKKATHKPIQYFSSGMKQRLKLGLAFYADVPMILLDEPTSNLDSEGIAWYKQEVQSNLTKQLVVICSNQGYEYDFCPNQINISDYKL